MSSMSRRKLNVSIRKNENKKRTTLLIRKPFAICCIPCSPIAVSDKFNFVKVWKAQQDEHKKNKHSGQLPGYFVRDQQCVQLPVLQFDCIEDTTLLVSECKGVSNYVKDTKILSYFVMF